MWHLWMRKNSRNQHANDDWNNQLDRIVMLTRVERPVSQLRHTFVSRASEWSGGKSTFLIETKNYFGSNLSLDQCLVNSSERRREANPLMFIVDALIRRKSSIKNMRERVRGEMNYMAEEFLSQPTLRQWFPFFSCFPSTEDSSNDPFPATILRYEHMSDQFPRSLFVSYARAIDAEHQEIIESSLRKLSRERARKRRNFDALSSILRHGSSPDERYRDSLHTFCCHEARISANTPLTNHTYAWSQNTLYSWRFKGITIPSASLNRSIRLGAHAGWINQ